MGDKKRFYANTGKTEKLFLLKLLTRTITGHSSNEMKGQFISGKRALKKTLTTIRGSGNYYMKEKRPWRAIIQNIVCL